MNTKKIFVLGVVLLFLSAGLACAATNLMQIGRSPFHKPPLTTPASLIKMVQDKKEEVKIGFEKAGQPELFEPFVTQILSADIQLVDFPKGSYFEWMVFKKHGNGVVRLARDVTWLTQRLFPVFNLRLNMVARSIPLLYLLAAVILR